MKVSVYVLATVLFFGTVSTVGAHELLPQVMITYIAEHPDATAEDIKAFAATQDSSVSENLSKYSGDELIDLLKKQDSSYVDTALDFIILGFKHILSGADHILFVLSLLLVFISISNVLKLVTAFTLSHSITLILAGTGLLVLSSSIVEPFIALSIAVMAIASVFYREHPLMKKNYGKIALVFFFGLFHGLGFAGLLTEIAVPEDKFALSLLAFNVGIEFGQLFIVALALPLIFLFRNKSWYNTAIKVFAVLIAIAGTVWFFERLTVLF